MELQPKPEFTNTLLARLNALSPIIFGIALGAVLVGVDLIGDSVSEAITPTNNHGLLEIAAAELLSPSTREVWVRLLLFVSGFAFGLVTGRLHSTALARILYQANNDNVSRLPNRSHFLKKLAEEATHARRNHSNIIVCVVALDHFKSVNDLLGHDGGDAMLAEVAQRLSTSFPDAACIARICSDRFGIVLRLAATPERNDTLTNKIQSALAVPFEFAGREIFITASIGTTVFPDDGVDADKILLRAEYALGNAKRFGRGSVSFFSADVARETEKRYRIESDLRRAIERNEFHLVYQPIVQAGSGEIRNIEALLRWTRQDGTAISPLDFIPAAESSGLIIPLGEWVLRRACEDTKRWHKQGYTALSVAVNVSSAQIKQSDFIHLVQTVLQETELPATALELEITESMLVHDFEATLIKLTQLREMGIRLSIDDFGTGYSSMSYLGRLPVDKLKIDRSFVRDLTPRSGNEAIVKAVVALANELRIGIVAEGVETLDQLEFLQTQGCQSLQGFLLSRPVDHDSCTQLLSRGIQTPQRAMAS